MYKHYTPLTENELEKAIALSGQVKYRLSTGSRRRVGRNGVNALSMYNYAKWFDWNKTQRTEFKSFFSPEVINKAVQGWFLEIPPGKGFLDVMDYWVDKPLSGRVVATALKAQTFYIDNKAVFLKAGDQIGFSLISLHEIKPSSEGQLWACVMIRGCYKEIVD